MKIFQNLLISAVIVLSGCTTMPTGQWVDVGTTGMGLAIGASETNPLGVVTLGVKAYAAHQISTASSIERPYLWSVFDSLGWGAAANNFCVITVILSAGNSTVACPIIGLLTGWGVWNNNTIKRDRAIFEAICKDERENNPNIVCVWSN
jgi:hypothetical protein